MHTNSSCGRGNPKSPPDLFVRQVEVETQDKHQPSLAIKASQRPSQLLSFVHIGASQRLRRIVGPEAVKQIPDSTAPCHAAFVRNDRQEPGSRLGPSTKGGTLSPRFQGSLLNRIFSVVPVSQHPGCQAKCDGEQGFDGAGEGSLVIKRESSRARAGNDQERLATARCRM